MVHSSLALGLLAVMVSCAPAAAPRAPQRRAGELMIEVGSRFVRANRAAQAQQWDLAVYDSHELEEVFTDDLLHGRWADNPTMRQEGSTFVGGPLATLAASARTHDAVGWAKVFEATVNACNACHRTGHVAFIRVDDRGAF